MAYAHCPSCQVGRLVTGTIHSSGVAHFRPDFVKFMSFNTADIKVHALMCSACGLISMVGDFEKLQRLEPRHGLEKEPAPASR